MSGSDIEPVVAIGQKWRDRRQNVFTIVDGAAWIVQYEGGTKLYPIQEATILREATLVLPPKTFDVSRFHAYCDTFAPSVPDDTEIIIANGVRYFREES